MRTYFEEHPPCVCKETVWKALELRYRIRECKSVLLNIENGISAGVISAVEGAKKRVETTLALETADKDYFNYIHGC